jgi:hypothetical protein
LFEQVRLQHELKIPEPAANDDEKCQNRDENNAALHSIVPCICGEKSSALSARASSPGRMAMFKMHGAWSLRVFGPNRFTAQSVLFIRRQDRRTICRFQRKQHRSPTPVEQAAAVPCAAVERIRPRQGPNGCGLRILGLSGFIPKPNAFGALPALHLGPAT